MNIPPGDFKAISKCCQNYDGEVSLNDERYTNAYKVLTTQKIDLWNWLSSSASTPPNKSFLFWDERKVEQIRELLVTNTGERGNSLSEVLQLRNLQFIARSSWQAYVEKVLSYQNTSVN